MEHNKNTNLQEEEFIRNRGDVSSRHTARLKEENRQAKSIREKSVPPKAAGGVLTRLASAKTTSQ